MCSVTLRILRETNSVEKYNCDFSKSSQNPGFVQDLLDLIPCVMGYWDKYEG